MAGTKLSATAQLKIEALTEARRKFDRIHSLVEQYAAAKSGEDALMSSLYRAGTDVQRLFMNNGYGVMADHANQITMLAKRGVGKQLKVRTFREAVASVRAAIEHTEKMIVDEEKKAHEQADPG
jgi:hypothetical protein